MENGMELLYHMAAVMLLCLAVTLFMVLYKEVDRVMAETKCNIYTQHVIWEE